jgi:hypothetical protein
MARGEKDAARGRKTGSLSGVNMDINLVLKGVTVTWLAQAFGMSPLTVKTRLLMCPHRGETKAGYLYDLREAAPYIIKPVRDLKEYLKSIKPEELPTKLQEKYWRALMQRIKYEERAGTLWRTETVLFVLGEVFQTIKFSLQLWADNLDRSTGLTTEQRELLRGMVDGLQDEIYTKLRDFEKSHRTPSVLGEGLGTSDEDDDDEEIAGDDEEDLIG